MGDGGDRNGSGDDEAGRRTGGADSERACYQCGDARDLLRDDTGLEICLECREEVQRQQQFIDWGFGEAPDDLG